MLNLGVHILFTMYLKLFRKILPGEEVLQRSGLVLFLTNNSISLLLFHFSDTGGEGVDVVEYSLHGNRNLIGLLIKEPKKNQSYNPQMLI